MITPKSMPRSNMLGAIAGSRKCWLACRPAITNPLTEKISVEIRLRRIRSATRRCCSRLKPGVTTPRTSPSASRAMMIDKPAATRKTRLAMRENRSQAAGRPLFSSVSESTGMKASASVPPETSTKIRSGILLAALKASSSADSPNWLAMSSWRAKPSTFSRPKKTATISAERAKRDMGQV